MAIAGSLALPALARRFSLKQVLLAGLVADTAAMGLLVASDPLRSRSDRLSRCCSWPRPSLGLGFGLTLSSISTYAGAFMPERRDVALTALNVLLGLGTALSPLLIAVFLEVGAWWYLPLIAAAGLVVLVVAALFPADGGAGDRLPPDSGTAYRCCSGCLPRPWCCTGSVRRCSETGVPPCC